MTFAPQGRNSTSKHGEVWAQNAITHTSQGLAEGAAPTQCQQLKRYWHLPRIRNQIEYLGQNTLR